MILRGYLRVLPHIINSLTNMQQLKNKINNYQSNVQSFKGNTYQVYEVDPFNPAQNFLYKRVMFGLKMYSPEELAKMPRAKQLRINRVYKRCQLILNLWKQEISITWTNNMFRHYFGEHPFLKPFWENTEPDPKFVNTLNFKDLGITKEMIIKKLVGEGILPANFYSLQ